MSVSTPPIIVPLKEIKIEELTPIKLTPEETKDVSGRPHGRIGIVFCVHSNSVAPTGANQDDYDRIIENKQALADAEASQQDGDEQAQEDDVEFDEDELLNDPMYDDATMMSVSTPSEGATAEDIADFTIQMKRNTLND